MDRELFKKVQLAARNLIEVERDALTRLIALPDSNEFAEAINILLECKGKIFTIGLGKSGLIGAKIAATFSSVGRNAIFIHAGDALHGDMGVLGKDDAAILISKSGETKELLEVLSFLQKSNNKTIAITNDRSSSLAKGADVDLELDVKLEGCPLNLAPMASTSATLTIGDALASGLMVASNFKPEKFAKYHPGGKLGAILTKKVSDIVDTENNPICNENSLLKDALLILIEKKMGAINIVNNQNSLTGFMTDGDVKRILVDFDYQTLNKKVNLFMTKKPITITLGESSAVALDLMEQRNSQISTLPVIDDKGRPVAILRLHDLIRSHY
ncbi:MAG: KpsF/GutQ family sugar-phosphate isomerase [Nitrospinota bacterium]